MLKVNNWYKKQEIASFCRNLAVIIFLYSYSFLVYYLCAKFHEYLLHSKEELLLHDSWEEWVDEQDFILIPPILTCVFSLSLYILYNLNPNIFSISLHRVYQSEEIYANFKIKPKLAIELWFCINIFADKRKFFSRRQIF